MRYEAGWAGLSNVRAIAPERFAAYLGSTAATHRQYFRGRSAVTVNALRSRLRGFFHIL